MNILTYLARTYNVAIDSTTFHAEPEDAFDGAPMLSCSVGLVGKPDLDWQKAFCFTQWDSIDNFFYRLSDDGKSVCFLSPRTEAAENATLSLRALASFLNLVNANANRRLGAHSDWNVSRPEIEFALTA